LRGEAGQGNSEFGDAAVAVEAVTEREVSVVGFGDLAAEGEADTGSAGFGGKEGDEQVGGIADAGAIVTDDDGGVRGMDGPGDID